MSVELRKPATSLTAAKFQGNWVVFINQEGPLGEAELYLPSEGFSDLGGDSVDIEISGTFEQALASIGKVSRFLVPDFGLFTKVDDACYEYWMRPEAKLEDCALAREFVRLDAEKAGGRKVRKPRARKRAGYTGIPALPKSSMFAIEYVAT